MRFELEGAAPVAELTPELVANGLHTLDMADLAYAILEQRPGTYLRAAPAGDGTYVLEILDGSPDQHFWSANTVPLDDVVAAFEAYLRQEEEWRSRYKWQRSAPAAGRGRPGMQPVGRPNASWFALGLFLLPLAFLILADGISRTMASAIGVPGVVVVTHCPGGRYTSCSGLFTPDDGGGRPAVVSIVDGPYQTATRLNDVRLLNGTAYPQTGDMRTRLKTDYVLGVPGLLLSLASAAFVAYRLLTARRRVRT